MNAYFNRLNLIFHGLIAVPLAAFVYLYLEIDTRGRSGALGNPETVEWLSYVLPTVCIVEAGVAFILFSRSIQAVREQEGLKRKLEHYFQVILQKYLLLASSGIIAVVGLFLTASTLYTALFLFMLLFLSIHRPTVYRIARDLKLEGEEKDIVVHKRDLPEE